MNGYIPKPGDIAACWGVDLQSRIISLGTGRLCAPEGLRYGPSHVALIAPDFHKTRLLWYESTTKCGRDCIFHQKPISGVQVHRIEDRVEDYNEHGGQVVIYRMVDEALLEEHDYDYMGRMLLDYLHDDIPYDMRGAIISGLRVTCRMLSLLGVSRRHLFCSDMIASVLMRVDLMNLSDPDSFTPAGLLRTLVNDGKYRRLKAL